MTDPVPEVREVAGNIYLIDAECAAMPKIFSSYLINEEKKALIDVGSPAAAGMLLKGLKSVGVNPRDIDYIILTHIHLDHSGAAGLIIQEMPLAKILTHPSGIKHLVDPGKLVNSTAKLQKDALSEAMRYDLTRAVDPARIQEVKDNEFISLGSGQQIKMIYTPGHAPYHLSVHEKRNNGVFVGDVAGHKFGDRFLPITPRPTDPNAAFASIEKLIALSPDLLYFPHWGVAYQAGAWLQHAIGKLKVWYDTVLTAVEKNPDQAMEELESFADAEYEAFKDHPLYRDIARSAICYGLEGYIDYFKKNQGKI